MNCLNEMNPVDASQVVSCDLCIIGAGAAGLNALFVATKYMKPDSKVILIDRRDGPGGMWTEVYDFCRLHQPHPAFTVGDIKWPWSMPSDYLAKGEEVEAHLKHCFDTIKTSVDLQPLFGHEVTSCTEIQTGRSAFARIECHPVHGTGIPLHIEARKVVKAIGYDVPTPKPLPLSSKNVVSTTPQELSSLPDSRTPVFVVGGGKTGMDTALALVKRSPGRVTNLINGKGTVFARRESLFPTGLRRWWDGHMVADVFRDVAMRFDGTNEDDAFDLIRRKYCVGLPGAAGHFFFGILSDKECGTIAGGVKDIINDYLCDVVDRPAGPVAILRSGKLVEVPVGSVFVNCTGHLLRHYHAYEPYLSDNGAILTITPRSQAHFQSNVSAYFLSHLFFSGKIRDVPLYEFDSEEILKKGNRLYHTALMALTFHNLLIMTQHLPFQVFNRCGLDNDRLYPLPRRVLALLKMKHGTKRYIAHCRAALDRVQQIHGVRCAPLSRHVAPQGNETSPNTSGGGAVRPMAAAGSS